MTAPANDVRPADLDVGDVLANLLDASLDEQRYEPAARDRARALLFAMRGGRAAYVARLRLREVPAKGGVRRARR